MNIDEIRALSDEGLLDELDDRKEQLYLLRFQKTMGQLEDNNLIGRTRRVIARIRTVQRERKLAEHVAAEKGKNS